MTSPRADIAYPWRFAIDGGTGLAGADRHVRDMIEQLLFTAPGERVNRPDLGSGLRRLIFAPNSAELAATLQFSVQAALQRFLGDVIEIGAVTVTAADATSLISIDYRVKLSGELGQAQLVLAQAVAF